MDCRARPIIVFFAFAAAILFIAGCAVEVPKSVLPAFRLTPPVATSATKPETSKPTEARDL